MMLNDAKRQLAVESLERTRDRQRSFETPLADPITPFLFRPGLVGCWPMSSIDLSGGDVADISGQLRGLTRNGNPTYSYLDGITPFIDLDGAGDYLSRADEADLKILGTETIYNSSVRGLAAGGWFWLDALPGAGVVAGLIGKTNSTGNQRSWVLYYSGSNNRLEFAMSSAGTSYDFIVNGPALSINTWYYIEVQFLPSAQGDIYVSGAQYTNTTGPIAALFNSTAAFQIGAFDAGANNLNGRASLCFLSANAHGAVAPRLAFHRTRVLFGV